MSNPNYNTLHWAINRNSEELYKIVAALGEFMEQGCQQIHFHCLPFDNPDETLGEAVAKVLKDIKDLDRSLDGYYP